MGMGRVGDGEEGVNGPGVGCMMGREEGGDGGGG